jgi:DNA helicase II / ATP-dependent DNA helicase PcrA
MAKNIDYLNELNSSQRAAVEATEGPVMIIAGAGSGKTRVLTYRIAYLMHKGTDAFNILALTFTNKAAREMKARISTVVGEKETKNLWMGTFHSVFAKILRFEADKLGYPNNFTIYDTDDSKGMIRDILKSLNLDDKVYKPNMVLNRISSAKNNLINASTYKQNINLITEDKASQKPLMGEIYEAYEKRCFKAGAMDFDDLLFNTNKLLRDFPDVLYKYQNKFKYIMVDEYQDTNFSQYVIVRQLAARFQNLCVVGDDAQSIYSFRGASIQNILNFEKDYPDLQTYKLEQNYRSTKIIVNAANQIIANNKEQLEKLVWTDNQEGEKIKVMTAATDNEEGQKVAAAIFEIRQRETADHKDFAILYRTNAQSRSFEESLRKLNIPYRIYGGLSFYQRKEIKDLLAYFRLAINVHDEESLKRIINYPTRGIGQTTIDKIFTTANEHAVSMWTVLDNLQDFSLAINSGTANKINDFVVLMKGLSAIVPYADAFEVATRIATGSTLLKDLYNDKTPEGVSRYENVQELLNGIKDFTENTRSPIEEELNDLIKERQIEVNPSGELVFGTPENETDTKIRTLDEFMQDISLLTDSDKDKDDDDKNKVSLMTIHASKGLEFPFVFVVGLEENLFPSQLSLQSRSDLEEERRLFYVAITRAEKKATLSYAHTRYKFGNLIYCEPSRFIEEIDDAYLDYPDVPAGNPLFDDNSFNKLRQNFNGNNSFSTGFKSSQPAAAGNSIPPKRNLQPLFKKPNAAPTNLPTTDEIRLIQIGSTVEHERFGIGIVKQMEGLFPNVKAIVEFEKEGAKNLILKYAKLKVLG